MAEQRDGRSLWESLNASWPTIVGLGTALVLGLLTLPPLDSSRPPSAKTQPLETIGEQDVDARLWQDPLTAAEGHPLGSDDTADPLHSVEYFRRQLRISANSTLVLPVLVSGAGYAEDTESRIRARVAVVSALGRAHYVPQDGEHIGFFSIRNWPRTDTAGSAGLDWWQQQAVSGSMDNPASSTRTVGETTTAATTKPKPRLPPINLVVAYEWWYQQGLVGHQAPSADDVRPQRVLVVWLRDEAMSDWPLRRFARLIDELYGDSKHVPDSVENRMKVLGPRRSGTLRNMVLEAASATLTDPVKQRIKGVKIYSATATAADDILTFNCGVANRSAEQVLWGCGGMELIRPIATDDMLCDALLEELNLRGVDVRGGRAAVALISEWDTLYSRALPLTFAARAQINAPPTARPGVERWVNDEHMKSKFAALLANPGHVSSPRIYHYGYLRGIDGHLPGNTSDRSAQQTREPFEDLDRARRPREMPEGLNQADYLRRLAQVLVRQDRQLRRENRGLGDDNQGLSAVGILGSDLYDKLMILRALRRELPSTLFFTTDLDVRFTHPSEWAQTHNLIVASPLVYSCGVISRWTFRHFATAIRRHCFTPRFSPLMHYRPAAIRPPRASSRSAEAARTISVRPTRARQPSSALQNHASQATRRHSGYRMVSTHRSRRYGRGGSPAQPGVRWRRCWASWRCWALFSAGSEFPAGASS
jgi:hypothetical protein